MAIKPVVYKNSGIIPDLMVTPGINDFLQGKDVQLQYALALAGRE